MIRLERSLPAPQSLREHDFYDTPETRERLYVDARGKCYLCERRVELSDFEIDHRKPKASGQFPELAREWTNLFCCCGKCNSLRPRLWPDGGLLSPDQPGDDVERRVEQSIDIEGRPRFRAAIARDDTAQNTAGELEKVHGADNKLRADDMREALLIQLQRVHATRQRMWELKAEGQVRSRRYAKLLDELRRLVSRNAPFTALIRSRFLRDKLVVSLFD